MSIINDSDIISSFKGHVSLTEIERAAINHFFSKHRADSLTLYHGSSRSNRTSILKKGLCLTSTKYCHGYSSFGFLYCSLYPDRAFEYGRMNSQSKETDIYAFNVMIRDILPDAYSLFFRHSAEPDLPVRNTLADSLVFSHGNFSLKHPRKPGEFILYETRDNKTGLLLRETGSLSKLMNQKTFERTR